MSWLKDGSDSTIVHPNEIKKSKLLIAQVIIFGLCESFLLLALLGLLVAPLVVYGEFKFSGFRFFTLFMLILLLAFFIGGLIKTKRWSYILGLVLISSILLLNLLQLIRGIYLWPKIISIESGIIKSLALLNFMFIFIILIIFSISLYLQIRLKDELRH